MDQQEDRHKDKDQKKHKHRDKDRKHDRDRQHHHKHRSRSKSTKGKSHQVPPQLEQITQASTITQGLKQIQEIPLQPNKDNIVPRKHEFIFIKDLPTKPTRTSNYKQKCKEIKLESNHFTVKYDNKLKLTIYSVKFEPFIDPQNHNLKAELIRMQHQSLKQKLGTYAFYSNLIIAGQESQDFNFKLQQKVQLEEMQYNVEIKKIKTVNFVDLDNPDPRCSDKAIIFFNLLIRGLFQNLNYFQHGRLKHFHDISKKQTINGTELALIPGFAISFHQNYGGFSFKIDISHRIVRTTTALQFINQQYKECIDKKRSKEDTRRHVRFLLCKQMILANYGTFRTFQVDDLIFDTNTSELEIEIRNGNGDLAKITIDSYFEQRYKYQIINKKAPLLMHLDKKSNKQLFLVPELCIMAGVPNDITEYQRREIQKQCQSLPKDRFDKLVKMQNDLLKVKSDRSLTLDQVQRDFGITISQNPQSVMGKQLAIPSIRFGNNNLVTPSGDQENIYFTNNNYSAFNVSKNVRYAIIYPPDRDFDFDGFKQLLLNQSKIYGITMIGQMQCFKISERRDKQSLEIEDILKNKIDKDVSLVIIVLNRYLKTSYQQFKQLALSERCGILTQMVLTDTVSKKGGQVVVQKVLMQMLDKIGNTIWCVQNPPVLTMIMTLIVEGGFAAFLCSLDEDYTKYYSQVSDNIKDRQCVTNIDQVFGKALSAYKEANNVFPDRILYFREGQSSQQIQYILDVEIQIILTIAQQLNPQFNNQLMVLNIQNSQITKLFRQDRNTTYNAPSGTIVDHTLTTFNYFEFILVPIYSNRGCPKPILYQVIYAGIKMPIEQLQDFIYYQCYNYSNWMGPIKVPAIVKYAQKMVKFIIEVTRSEPVSKMRHHLYYL